MTKSQQKIVGIATAIAAVVVIGGYMLLIGPQWSAHKEAKAEAATSQAALLEAQSQEATLRSQQAGLSGLVNSVNAILNRFPSNLAQEELFNMIIDGVADTGVDIKSITPSVPQDPAVVTDTLSAGTVLSQDPNLAEGEVGTFPIALSQISITAEGDIEDQVAFLEALEDLPRPISLRSVTIRGGEISVIGRIYLTRPLVLPESLGGPPAAEAPAAGTTDPTTGATTPAAPGTAPSTGGDVMAPPPPPSS